MDRAAAAHRILVVDDDPDLRAFIAELLGREGYRVEVVASGPEALGRARRSPPDLIVLDVAMADMDGFEVCRHLRADARTATVPILFLTGLDAPRDRQEGLAAGADDYVIKPVDPADLLVRVGALMEVRHLSREIDRTLAYLQQLEAARRGLGGAAGGGRPRGGDRATPLAAEESPAGHVLLVDDEAFARQLYGNILQEAGYRVTCAASAAEAYAAAAEGVDVIVLDILMPEVSGLDALKRLAGIAPDVPIIILTAYQSAQNAISALRGGALDFIVKGITPELVVHSVRRAVEGRRLLREHRRLRESLGGRGLAARGRPTTEAPRPERWRRRDAPWGRGG